LTTLARLGIGTPSSSLPGRSLDARDSSATGHHWRPCHDRSTCCRTGIRRVTSCRLAHWPPTRTRVSVHPAARFATHT